MGKRRLWITTCDLKKDEQFFHLKNETLINYFKKKTHTLQLKMKTQRL